MQINVPKTFTFHVPHAISANKNLNFARTFSSEDYPNPADELKDTVLMFSPDSCIGQLIPSAFDQRLWCTVFRNIGLPIEALAVSPHPQDVAGSYATMSRVLRFAWCFEGSSRPEQLFQSGPRLHLDMSCIVDAADRRILHRLEFASTDWQERIQVASIYQPTRIAVFIAAVKAVLGAPPNIGDPLRELVVQEGLRILRSHPIAPAVPYSFTARRGPSGFIKARRDSDGLLKAVETVVSGPARSVRISGRTAVRHIFDADPFGVEDHWIHNLKGTKASLYSFLEDQATPPPTDFGIVPELSPKKRRVQRYNPDTGTAEWTDGFAASYNEDNQAFQSATRKLQKQVNRLADEEFYSRRREQKQLKQEERAKRAAKKVRAATESVLPKSSGPRPKPVSMSGLLDSVVARLGELKLVEQKRRAAARAAKTQDQALKFAAVAGVTAAAAVACHKAGTSLVDSVNVVGDRAIELARGVTASALAAISSSLSSLPDTFKEGMAAFMENPYVKFVRYSVLAIVIVHLLKKLPGTLRAMVDLFLVPFFGPDVADIYDKPVLEDQSAEFGLDFDQIANLVHCGVQAVMVKDIATNFSTGGFKCGLMSLAKSARENYRLGDGLQGMVEVGADMINFCLKHACQLLHLNVVQIKSNSGAHLSNFIEKVDMIVSRFVPGFVPSFEDIIELKAYKPKFSEMYASYCHMPRARTLLARAEQKFNDVITQYASIIARVQNLRPEPVCVVLMGPPGCGKSSMIPQLMRDATFAAYPEKAMESDSSFCYDKDFSDFWSGYNSQSWLRLDDLLALIPVPGKMGQATILMSAIGDTPYPLDMPGLPQKGNIYFNSIGVACTTNMKRLNDATKVLAHLEALKRRLHHVYKLILNENSEFAVRNDKWVPGSPEDCPKFFLNKDAVLRYCTDNPGQYPWHAWQVQELTPNASEFLEVGSPQPTTHLIDVVSKHILQNKKIFDGMANLGRFVSTHVKPPVQDQSGHVFPEGLVIPPFAAIAEACYKCSDDYKPVLEEVETDKEKSLGVLRCLRRTAKVVALGVGILLGFKVVSHIVKAILGLVKKPKSAAFHRCKSMMEKLSASDLKSVEQHIRSLRQDQSLGTKGPIFKDDGLTASHNQIYKLYAHGKSDSLICHVLNIGDGIYLLNAHSLKIVLAAGVNLSLERIKDGIVFPIDYDAFSACPTHINSDADIACVRLPKTFPVGANLHKFFLSETDKSIIVNRAVVLTTYTTTNIAKQSSASRHKYHDHIDFPHSDLRKYVIGAIEVPRMSTYQGDCGCLYAVEPAVSCRSLYAIHTAGGADGARSDSYGSVITQELLKSLCTFTEDQNGFVVPKPLGEGYSFKFVRTVPPAEGRSNNPFTKWQPSKIKSILHKYPIWGPVDKCPARLVPGIIADGTYCEPIVDAVRKYGGQQLVFPQDKIDKATYTAFGAFRATLQDRSFRAITFEEACQGIEGNSTAKSLSRKTSPGYPMCLRLKKGRKEVFGGEDEFEFTSEACAELKAEVLDVLEKARNGVRSEHIFADFPKDEVRDRVKYDTGATRLISSCPLVYLIAFRMLFLDLFSAIQDSKIISGCAVGCNQYKDWTQLAKHLTAYSDKGFAGDFKAFDAREQAQILEALGEQFSGFYDDDYNTARRVLWQDVYNSRHIGGNGVGPSTLIYDWVMALPSGHPGTSFINSFYNITLFILVFGDLTKKDMKEFWDWVRITTYGDDNMVFPKPAIAEVMNQYTVPAAMLQYGMIYTDEAKTGQDLGALRHIDQMGFLKRGFRLRDDGFSYDCPLEMATIRALPCFVPKGTAEETIQTANLETVLRELALHGRDVFEEKSSAVLKMFVEAYGIRPQENPKWTTYVALVRDMDNPW